MCFFHLAQGNKTITCVKFHTHISDLSGSLNEEGVEIISNANCNQTQRSIRDYMICSTGRNSSECRVSRFIAIANVMKKIVKVKLHSDPRETNQFAKRHQETNQFA